MEHGFVVSDDDMNRRLARVFSEELLAIHLLLTSRCGMNGANGVGFFFLL